MKGSLFSTSANKWVWNHRLLLKHIQLWFVRALMHLFFYLLPAQTAIYIHAQRQTCTIAISLNDCVVYGAERVRTNLQTHTHTHKLLLVFSRQWWPWVQSLLLACEQNAKLTPVTHSCVCVFQSFQKFRFRQALMNHSVSSKLSSVSLFTHLRGHVILNLW